jgi:hypothetical protein
LIIGEAPYMAFGHYIREALVSEQGSDEKREKPFTLSQRFLTLLRAEQLLALAGGQDQKKIKSVPSHTPQQRSTF